MVEDCLPTRTFAAEKMPNREQAPLAAALELVEYGVHDLNKIKSGGISSFCNRKIRHYFSFYCIFVEYSVFWHWYGILQCGNYNIVRPLRNALYFNYFTVSLTYRNKFRQLLLMPNNFLHIIPPDLNPGLLYE